MASYDHDHEDGFEAGCPACERDEVSLQDTGRRWGVAPITHPTMRATRKHLAANPLPGQRKAGAA